MNQSITPINNQLISNESADRRTDQQPVNISRLLRPDIVQFHFACLGTEIFLRGLTLSNTLSSNPKFFIVQRHE